MPLGSLLVNTRHKRVGHLTKRGETSYESSATPSFAFNVLTGETNMGSISIVRKPPHAKTFGMELECYPKPGGRANYELLRKQWHGFWEATEDGSIYDGVEFVSQPMPYDMLVKQIKWLDKKFPWTVTNTCGLHIHVSRKYWSEKRERDFSSFLESTAIDSDVVRWFGRSSPYARVGASRFEKFRAINVRHDATFEFRVWKAGDLAWTLEALKRTRAIVEYQGQYTVEWMNTLCEIKDESKPASSLKDLSRARNRTLFG